MSTGDVVSQFLVDRVPARGLQLRSARRSLFGPVDHAETEKLLKEELEKQGRSDRKKWNFDFANERPLNSDCERYEWEPCAQRVAEDPDAARPAEDVPRNSRINGGFQTEDEAVDLTLSGQKHRQLQITDFMRKRKHSLNRKVEPPEADTSAAKNARRSPS